MWPAADPVAAAEALHRLHGSVCRQLALLPPAISGYLLAFSGGRDSTVLLHAMHAVLASTGAAIPLRAIHVHHGLQSAADDWAKFCVEAGTRLGIAVEVVRIDARPLAGEGPEASARRCRYLALDRALHAGEVLLTAHHQQDQAETVLLQLLRGAGPAGLSAMPSLRRFGSGWHLRPLLDVDVELIDRYVHGAGIQWIEDPSNQHQGFDRNYLRHRVMPLLRHRWPAATRTISRAARWQAEAAELLAEQADADLDAVRSCDSDGLSIERLLALAPANRSAALRVWVARRGFPPPDADQLMELGAALIVRPDASPCVRWPGVEVRRHRDVLMIMAPLPRPDPGMVVEWFPAAGPLRLPFGSLSVEAGRDALETAPRSYSVRYRRGGEQCRMVAGGPTRPVKHLLQEWGIPTWLRAGLPLVYSGELLVALADRTTADAAPGLALRWDWVDGVGGPAGSGTATRRGS